MINKKRLFQIAITLCLLVAIAIAWYWSGKLSDRGKRVAAVPGASASQTLINFKQYALGNSKAQFAKMESVDVVEVRKLLATVDIDDFVADAEGCQRDSDSAYLFGVNQVSGQFVPGGGKQSLISIEVGSCGELRFNAQRHAFLVVHGTVRQHFDACMDSALLLGVPGPDALQDIVLICDWRHMGVSGTYAAIYGHREKQFGMVLPLRGYEDSCDVHPESGETVWSILKRGKTQGLYREEVHTTQCKK